MSPRTVTAKGQITLRKDLLQHLGARPGEKLIVDKLPDGRIAIKAARPARKISDVFGFLKRKNCRDKSERRVPGRFILLRDALGAVIGAMAIFAPAAENAPLYNL